MKQLILSVLLAGLAATGKAAPTAGEALTPAVYDSLTKLSETLFEAHSNDFIIVEALRDGYLEFGKAYNIRLNTDSAVVVANGQALPRDVSLRYQRRLSDFRYYSGNAPKTRFSIAYSGDGFTLADLLDPKSPFRKTRIKEPFDPQRTQAQANVGRIVGELVRDGIVTDQANFSIDYTSSGLRVNNAALSSAMDAKYRMLFRVLMDVEPRDGKGDYHHSVLTNGAR